MSLTKKWVSKDAIFLGMEVRTLSNKVTKANKYTFKFLTNRGVLEYNIYLPLSNGIVRVYATNALNRICKALAIRKFNRNYSYNFKQRIAVCKYCEGNLYDIEIDQTTHWKFPVRNHIKILNKRE